MSVTVERLIAELEPGDIVPLESFEAENGAMLKKILLDELEARGFVLDSSNRLGEVEICELCSGDGGQDKACRACDDYGATITFGRGRVPFKQ